MVAFATRRHIDQGDVDHRRRLRHWLTARFTQQNWPAGNRKLSTSGLETLQAAHASRHDQCVVGWSPEQQAVILFTLAHRRQQILLGMQAGLDSHIQ
ncbi:hypothetical protein D3C75_1093470 [compost metagenome]